MLSFSSASKIVEQAYDIAISSCDEQEHILLGALVVFSIAAMAYFYYATAKPSIKNENSDEENQIITAYDRSLLRI
jgi:hypothetical protein